MEHIGITIIGGGLIGLAIADQLSKSREVALIERHERAGTEVSSRNSEVIHAGIYYPKDSLKARLCIEGKNLLYKLCEENNIPFKRTGKLIIAADSDASKLEELIARGCNNGVEGLEIIEENLIKLIEPNLRANFAIYSPSSGIIEVHRLMDFLESRARAEGCLISYNSEVISINKKSNCYELMIKTAKEQYAFSSRIIINAAGLSSDKVAQLAGIDIEKEGYKLHYCKGEYFYVRNGKGKLRHLVYSTPQKNLIGLGIHVTLDLEGELKLGPSAFYIDNLDYSVNESNKDNFFRAASPYLPFLKKADLYPGFAAIRPKLQGPMDNFRDFLIAEETAKGFPGFINLIGIESPGLTCSLAIARHVGGMIDETAC